MNILAAFIFFTRLPFWKIKEVPAECFKHVVPYWSLTGWLTGGIMAGTLWITGQILPISIAWITAIIVRLLVTGCLHEDGLADFLDGFGGGTTRERTLAIMKDSHIGSYGVIGLIIYFLLLSQLSILPLHLLCHCLADILAAGPLLHQLPQRFDRCLPLLLRLIQLIFCLGENGDGVLSTHTMRWGAGHPTRSPEPAAQGAFWH